LLRQLIHVPIVHEAADLGSATAALERVYGAAGWERHQTEVARYWTTASEAVLSLDLDWRQVKLYQDGHVAEGELGLKIVNEIAAHGSRNYRLLQELIRRGGTLVQTEELALVQREHEWLRESLAAQTHGRPQPPAPAEVLSARDAFIARRIDETLAAGETGIAFLGAAHNLVLLLPADIRVTPLLPGPALGR